MSSELIPEDVASRSFGHTLRGYDPRQVRDYLEEVADQLRRLRGQYLAARQELGAVEDNELESQIDSATADINELLHAARLAAQQMTDRATRHAEDVTARANQSATEAANAAEVDAAQLRAAAWDTSTEMLEQVAREVAAVRKQADRDALAIVGEAERNAHKKLATAKRDADGKLRSARLESERVLVEARAERDEMLDQAARATDAAQERTRALERRREELMAELEDLRLQREAPPESPGRRAAATVRLVHSDADLSDPPAVPAEAPPAQWIEEDDVHVVGAPVQHAPWADGSDTVRLVESPLSEEDAEVDADEVAGEVARLRAASESREDESAASPVEVSTDEPEIEEDESSERDLAKAWSSTKARPRAGSDELGSLFMELRVDPEDEDEPETAAAEAPAPDVSEVVTEDTPIEALLPVEVISPFELRDRSLLPITNRALRDVKRQLADVQNQQLDELKGDPANWQPNRSDLEGRITQELLVVQRESYVAGFVAAAELVTGTAPSSRVDTPDGETSPFVSALFDEVVLTVQAGREAGHGARELGNAVSKVYRVWRTDEAERRMRQLAGAAYHGGLLKGFEEAGVSDVQMLVDGSCDGCIERAAMGVAVTDSDVLPVHDECRCTIVPG